MPVITAWRCKFSMRQLRGNLADSRLWPRIAHAVTIDMRPDGASFSRAKDSDITVKRLFHYTAELIVNLVETENTKPGTSAWRNSYGVVDQYLRSGGIEAYCSQSSVAAGDTIETTVGTYTASVSAQVVLITRSVTLLGG